MNKIEQINLETHVHYENARHIPVHEFHLSSKGRYLGAESMIYRHSESSNKKYVTKITP